MHDIDTGCPGQRVASLLAGAWLLVLAWVFADHALDPSSMPTPAVLWGASAAMLFAAISMMKSGRERFSPSQMGSIVTWPCLFVLFSVLLANLLSVEAIPFGRVWLSDVAVLSAVAGILEAMNRSIGPEESAVEHLNAPAFHLIGTVMIGMITA